MGFAPRDPDRGSGRGRRRCPVSPLARGHRRGRGARNPWPLSPTPHVYSARAPCAWVPSARMCASSRRSCASAASRSPSTARTASRPATRSSRCKSASRCARRASSTLALLKRLGVTIRDVRSGTPAPHPAGGSRRTTRSPDPTPQRPSTSRRSPSPASTRTPTTTALPARRAATRATTSWPPRGVPVRAVAAGRSSG